MSTHAADGLIHDIYRRYAEDRTAVDSSFGAVFDGLEGAILTDGPRRDAEQMDPFRTALVLSRLIEATRWRGHLGARLDPLGLTEPKPDAEIAFDRALLRIADQEMPAPLAGELGLRQGSVGDVLARLDAIYGGSIGFEYMQIGDPVAREWLRHAIETGAGEPDAAARRAAARHLIAAEEFETFLQRRFVGKKRFGAEGAESLICACWAVLTRAAALGVRSVVMAGTSRARLSQLANVVGKPLHAILAEVKGASPVPEGIQASGDVAYHQGYVNEQEVDGARLRIEYCANPSHLETVDGVAAGCVRAIQDRHASVESGHRHALGLMVHTDAAFAGQGIVAEVAQLAGLPNYHVGGTIHVIVNNQLGFTTEPSDGRTSPYCSDLGRIAGCPVFHVNGDDVDAVVRVGTLAATYRQRFGKDAIIDLVCYRRNGHNEMDEPSFTQPRMYARIAAHPTTRRIYLDRLAGAGVFDAAEEQAATAAMQARLNDAYEAATTYRPNQAGPRDALPGAATARRSDSTGLALDDLRIAGKAVASAPAGIRLHPKVERVFAERLQALDSGEGINWGFAEGLALATLIRDGTAIRMSGQDTPRGAFSQRHFVVHDRETGASASVFAALGGEAANATRVFGSPLSEYATLGFEYGYSLHAPTPETLVIWEAQFGDFANVAQPILDQFIASGEDKWLQSSALTVLLPHGLEGQGAEHSSARIERMLQLCAADNMTLANVSTPANYFHLLRRQATGPRRPLLVFTPKSLLRHRVAVSRLTEMGPGTQFQPVIGPPPGEYRRLVLCSGKLFWELEAERHRLALHDVGLVRIEQLYPFPAEELAQVLQAAQGAAVLWCQEEPRNMGAWDFVDRRIETLLRAIESTTAWPAYVGRPANPSPAIGTTDQHTADQAALIQRALTGDAA